MDSTKESYLDNKFGLMQSEFRRQLPIRLSAIEELWISIEENSDNKELLKKLQHTLLQLAGAGSTYGADEVSALAAKLESKFKLLLLDNNISSSLNASADNNKNLNEWFKQLRDAVDEWLSSYVAVNKPVKSNGTSQINLVYTLLGDDLFAAVLSVYLEKKYFKVKCFHELSVIEAACEEELPAVIIVDEEFTDNNIIGVDAVASLKNNIEFCAPVIFISNSIESEARLAAVRADADRYFYKTVSMSKIIHAIKGLNSESVYSPYRVMLVDDDMTLLGCYAEILSKSNLSVESVSEPLKAFDRIEIFQPDVIIVDMHMPECSGSELVHMIRQDDRWALIPLIFLSAEQDINNQLDAMALGADDFLVKPVHANKLVATVNVTAKRARKNVKLNQDLKNALQENKYQLVTLDKHAIVSTTDVAGRIIHVNDKLCEISGYSREELIGQNHRILKSDQHDDAVYKNLWATISSGKIWHGVICNFSKNGDEYWVDSTIVPFIDVKGKPYKYVSIRTDVTALRVNEQRLKRSQAFANIGSWDWNIITGDLHWSERIWPLFGYKKETTETTYDNFLEAIHPDDRQSVIAAVNNCVENTADYDIEHRVVWPDGSVHWVHESGDVVRNKDGIALHMLGVVRDITELKNAVIRQEANTHILELIVLGQPLEEILHTIVAHAETFFPESHCSILLIDSSGKYLKHAIAPSLPGFYIDAIENVEIGMGIGACGEAAFTGKRVIVRDIMTHPNWMCCRELAIKTGLHACWSEPFSSSAGTVLGTFAIYFSKSREPDDNDIKLLIELAHLAAIAVERDQSHKALLSAKEEAEFANKAKSHFLSSMSHELRTPMNAIMGFSQLLKVTKSQPLTEAQGENVDEILVAGKHLMSLIDEVLDLSKIETGHIDLSYDNVILSAVISETLHLITPLAQKRGIEILLEKNGKRISLEELIKQEDSAWLDATRFKQVVLNLLSNAVKYNSENGKVILACNYAGTDSLRISVTDSGSGLSEEQQHNLFKSFNRLGREQTNIEGVGIGLVITKKIIERMGGHIGVLSEIDVGSTFWIELPIDIDRVAKRDISNENEKSEQPGVLESDMTELELKNSVLYIEDNPANLRLVEQILQSIPNLHMWSAAEPRIGLELAMEHLPDLILLDINLPGMDGYEVLKRLRNEEATRDIPVIAISANAMPKDIKKGEEAGFDGYITKPVNVKELLLTVEGKLSQKK